jgi:hypothetical protein
MKKILLGILTISTIATANVEVVGEEATVVNPQLIVNPIYEKGTWTKRLGLNYSPKGEESWKTEDKPADYNVYNISFGLNMKLLYNVTNKFRMGLEAGYESMAYTEDLRKDIGVKNNIGMITLGPTLEYDIYQNSDLSIYLNTSGGFAYSKTSYKQTPKNGKQYTDTLKANTYLKAGIGIRDVEGFGLEVGGRGILYKYEYLNQTTSSYKTVDMTSATTYIEVNYSF